MKTITWEPGTNSELDQEFEKLREAQYKNSNHRLWKNYSKDSFKSAIALTIYVGRKQEIQNYVQV